MAATRQAPVAGAPAAGTAPAFELPERLAGTVHVPADGAILLSANLLEIEDGFAFLDLLTGLYPALAARLNAVRGPLDLPAFSSSELSTRGISGGTPLFASLGRVEEAELDKKLPPVVRHRFVFRVSAPEKFLPFAVAVLGRMGAEVAWPGPDGKDRNAARFWKPYAGLGRKAGVALAARAPDGVAVLLRLIPDGMVLIDAAAVADPPPAPPVPPGAPGKKSAKPEAKKDPKKELDRAFARALTALLTDRRNGASAPAPLSTMLGLGTRKYLTEAASLVVVAQPSAMARLLPNAACRVQLGASSGAFFEDAALIAQLDPFNWRARLSFALSPEGQAAFPAAGANDGLVDARELAESGIASAVLYTPALASLHTLRRPPVVAGDLAATLERAEACGSWAVPLLFARFWPHAVDLAVSETARMLDAGWAATVARNIAFSVKSLLTAPAPVPAPAPADANPAPGASAPPAPNANLTLLLSLPGEREADLTAALARLAQGKPETAAFGLRAPRLYTLSAGSGFRAGGIETLSAGRLGLALSPDDNGLGWYYGQKRRPAVFGSRLALGAAHFNVGRFLQIQAESFDTSTRDAVRIAASQVGILGGELTLVDGFLDLALSLSATDAEL